MSSWISVEDRLPEMCKLVLVFWPATGNELCQSWIIDIASIHGGIFHTKNVGFRKIENITHWQPLPEPPEAV